MYRYHDRGAITTHLKYHAKHRLTGQLGCIRTLTASARHGVSTAYLPWSVKRNDISTISHDDDERPRSSGTSTTQSRYKDSPDPRSTSRLRLGFFSSNEKRFAALTRLPEMFFRDIRSIRAIVGQDVSRTTVERTPTIQSADNGTRMYGSIYTGGETILRDATDIQTSRRAVVNTQHQETSLLAPNPPGEGNDFLSYDQLWTRRRITNKADLSLRHPVSLRNAVGRHVPNTTSSIVNADSYEDTFRANRGSRRTTKALMKVVYPFLVSDDISQINDRDLWSVVGDARHNEGRLSDQEVLLLFDCCYLLHMKPSRAICKYIRISVHRASNLIAPMPSFVLLQLLRADSSGFTAASLTFLVDHLFEAVAPWAVDRSESIIVMALRLIRHARVVSPALLESITDVTLRLMDVRFHAGLDRNEQTLRAAWCNTLMSMLAVPATLEPMRSMIFQQRSQLSVLRYMQSAHPSISLDREGYRGMMRVQLAHRKTPQEREWAKTKVLSWPPWQDRHQMGGRSTNELEGKVSRVMKVVNHMTDEGYDTRQYDLAAQILAGWDTDKSPTIQTRVSSMRLPLKEAWQPGAHHVKADTSPSIWTARVLATRTLREAWMCFCDYTKTVPTERRSIDVYHAMFEKLHASTKAYDDAGPLPGDGRENFPDSNLSRDLVYIPTSVPTQRDLFDQLKADGLATTSRLLASLLRNASNVTQVKHYLTHSHLSQAVVEALMDSGKLDEETQHSLIDSIPSHLLSSIIYAFVQPYPRTKEKETIEMQLMLRDSARYIMRKNFTSDHRVWNLYFQAWSTHVDRSKKDVARLSTYQLWPLVFRAVRAFQARGINTTFFTLRAILPVAQNAALNYRIIESSAQQPLVVVKQLFVKAAYGPDFRIPAKSKWCQILRIAKVEALHSLPLGDDIEAMVWLLTNPTNFGHVEDVLSLLYWLNRHLEKDFADTRRISKHNLCAFRIVLEGLWIDEELRSMGVVKVLNEDQRKSYAMLQRSHTWPSDETILWYTEKTGKGAFFTQLRNAWKHVHRRQESGMERSYENPSVVMQLSAEVESWPQQGPSISRVYT